MNKLIVLLLRSLSASMLFTMSVHAATYYIDYEYGLDSNKGTSRDAPWKRHPYMKGWAGGTTYIHAAGDRFVFKGGVIWPAASLPLNILSGGSSGSPDTYDVDPTWYVGDSFSRPIFDAQGSATNGIVTISNPSNIIINNFEMRDVVFTSNEGNGIISIGYAPKNIRVQNSYLHKWTLSSGISKDDAHGGIIVSTANVPPIGIIVDSTTISNSEYSTSKNNGVAVRSVQTVSNSIIFDVPTAILYAGDVHGNTIYNINYPVADFDPTYHTNLIYMAAQSFNPPSNLIYNNVIHDVATGAGVYVEPCFYSSFGSATVSVYNNIVFNARMGGGGIILVDPEGGSGSCGNVYIYNNTLQQPDGSSIGMVRTLNNHSGTNRISTLVTQNNLYIGPNGEWDLNLASIWSSSYNLQLSNAAASAAGYYSGNLYRPPSATSPSVDRGSATSCKSVSCPQMNLDVLGVSRPQGKAWDVGAHEFGTVPPVAPPKGLAVR